MQGAAANAGAYATFAATDQTIKVEKSVSQFDQNAKAAKTRVLANLNGGLQAMGQCEDTYFKNKDWYVRFGQFYYQFMDARY